LQNIAQPSHSNSSKTSSQSSPFSIVLRTEWPQSHISNFELSVKFHFLFFLVQPHVY
jgi:hypothetical protein